MYSQRIFCIGFRNDDVTKSILYVVRTVYFGMKLYNDQRNAPQFFNLSVYSLLPYMFRAFFQPIFRGRCTTSVVVQVSWIWCQRTGANTIPTEVVHLPLKIG
jgi:hypothetical protein